MVLPFSSLTMSWQLGPPGALIVLFLSASGLGLKYVHKLFYGEFQTMEKSPFALHLRERKFYPHLGDQKSE